MGSGASGLPPVCIYISLFILCFVIVSAVRVRQALWSTKVVFEVNPKLDLPRLLTPCSIRGNNSAAGSADRGLDMSSQIMSNNNNTHGPHSSGNTCQHHHCREYSVLLSIKYSEVPFLGGAKINSEKCL